jgi:hypothetical protein
LVLDVPAIRERPLAARVRAPRDPIEHLASHMISFRRIAGSRRPGA